MFQLSTFEKRVFGKNNKAIFAHLIYLLAPKRKRKLISEAEIPA